jgi:hypothetical protein
MRTTRLAYLILFDFVILTVCGVQIMIRLIMQFPLACYCVLPVRSKNFLQRPVFRHPQPMSFLGVRDHISYACKTSANIVLCVFQCFRFYMAFEWGPLMVAQRLRYCITSRKVPGSIPDGVIGIVRWHNPSDRTMALGSTQPLTEMSTRSISWG